MDMTAAKISPVAQKHYPQTTIIERHLCKTVKTVYFLCNPGKLNDHLNIILGKLTLYYDYVTFGHMFRKTGGVFVK